MEKKWERIASSQGKIMTINEDESNNKLHDERKRVGEQWQRVEI